MIKSIVLTIVLTLLLFCCTDKREEAKTPRRFTSFEIGYSNGWTTGISFLVDSNKIFFSPQKSNLVKYGVVPDSIFLVIEAAFQKTVADTTIKSRDRSCEDCSEFVLQAIIGHDTINIHQRGQIDSTFTSLVKTIQNFTESTSHPIIRIQLFLESQKIAFPPPLPPVPNNFNFLTPESMTKSGR